MLWEDQRDAAYAELILDSRIDEKALDRFEELARSHDDHALQQAILERRLEQGVGAAEDIAVSERLADVFLATGDAARAHASLRRAAYLAHREGDAVAEERLVVRLAALHPDDRRAVERFAELAAARGDHGAIAAYWGSRLVSATDPGRRAEALDAFEHATRRAPAAAVDLAPLAAALATTSAIGFAARIRGTERRIRSAMAIAPSPLRDHDGSIAPSTTCPSCGLSAPVIVEGDRARCSACRAPLSPKAGGIVSVANTATKVSGAVARVFGWLTLVSGVLASLAFGLFFHWLWPGSSGQYIVAALTALMTVPLALFLLGGGGFLAKRGAANERARHVDLLRDLAAHHGGAITAGLAARTIGRTTEEADKLLTDLATEPGSTVEVDVTEQGEVLYRFSGSVEKFPARVRAPSSPKAADAAAEPLDETDAAAEEEARRGANL